MPLVLLSSSIHAGGISLLRRREDVRFKILDGVGGDALALELAAADALIIRTETLAPEAVSRAPRLKVVARHGVGYDNIPVDKLNELGIPLALVGGANAISVAEHVIYQLLALARKGPWQDRLVRDGSWSRRSSIGAAELSGRTLLLVGFGRAGRGVAKRALAMDMRVLACDPNVAGEVFATAGVQRMPDWRAALGEADAVSLHVPGGADNAGMINARILAAMKPGAWLVNSARGDLVDEQALADALRDNRLGGAALDVFGTEPPPRNHPLFSLANVILTPHSAALTGECLERMGMECAQNALDGIDGKLRPEMLLNPQVLKKSSRPA